MNCCSDIAPFGLTALVINVLLGLVPGWAQDLPMRQLLADQQGVPLVCVAGNVFAASTPLSLTSDAASLLPVGDSRLQLLQRFMDYQRLLEAGQLTEALAYYAPGQAQERARAKFAKNPEQQIAQRKALRLEIRGCGVAGEVGVVWYDLVGESLPGGRFPWMDQFRRVGEVWLVDPTIPINAPAFTVLGATMEAGQHNDPVVPVSWEKFAFFTFTPAQALQVLKKDEVPVKEEESSARVLVAVSRTLLHQKPVKLDKLDGSKGPAGVVLGDAYRAATTGQDASAHFHTQPGRPLKEAPFNWGKNEGSLDHLYAMAGNDRLTLAVIGTAAEPRQTIVLFSEEGRAFKIALATPQPRRSVTFSLLGSQSILGQGLKVLEASVE